MNLIKLRPPVREPWAFFETKVLDKKQLQDYYGIEGFERRPTQYPYALFAISASLEKHAYRWEEEERTREEILFANVMTLLPRFVANEHYFVPKRIVVQCGIIEKNEWYPNHYEDLFFRFFPLSEKSAKTHFHFTCFEKETLTLEEAGLSLDRAIKIDLVAYDFLELLPQARERGLRSDLPTFRDKYLFKILSSEEKGVTLQVLENYKPRQLPSRSRVNAVKAVHFF